MVATAWHGVKLILAWLLLAVLTTVVAWQLYGLVLTTGWVVIQSDQLRPSGWSSATILTLSKFAILVIGSCWLFFVVLFENLLSRWQKQKIMRQKLFQMAGILVASAIFLFLIGHLIG